LSKTGIFGGTFNPPHVAHSIIAEEVREKLNLDRILFIPSGNHPLKDSISAIHRLEMAKLAFSGNEYFEVSDIEVSKRDEKNYTVDTLTELKSLTSNPVDEFYLIIGSDNLIELPKWKNPERLFELSRVVVIKRPDYESGKAEKRFTEKALFADVPLMEISSSEIRKKVSERKSIKYLVHPDVEKYIQSNKLYI